MTNARYITGKRDASRGETRVWAIRDTEADRSDIALFYSEEERNTALASLKANSTLTSGSFDWNSNERGGSWQNPPVWDDPEEEPDYKALYEAMAARVGKEANDRGWCSEYDDIASEEGWPARPPREVSYRSYLRVELQFPVVENVDGANAALRAAPVDVMRSKVIEALEARLEYFKQHPHYMSDYATLLDGTQSTGTALRAL